MEKGWAFIVALALVAMPLAALGDVIPISDVNADDEMGAPVLGGETVTVAGIVTVGTGTLAANTDIFVQDGTGGVNVTQSFGASPVVALGDSVLVTGVVGSLAGSGTRTLIKASTSADPAARITILSSGNPLPAPVVVTPRGLASESGEEFEGLYVVVHGVSIWHADAWPEDLCSEDQSVRVADSDTTCRIWFDADTDLCGSPAPHEPFDVVGVAVPPPRDQAGWSGHGVLPPTRAHVRSRGSGSGFAGTEAATVYAGQTIGLTVSLEGETDVLGRVEVGIPDGWTFSGEPSHVTLSGAAFATARVVPDSTSATLITVADAGLTVGVEGTIAIANLGTPASAGPSVFAVSTALVGGELAPIGAPPVVDVWTLAASGAVLINEIYSNGATSSGQANDSSEFIELRNTTAAPIDLTGWVLTDMDNSGSCSGSNLWGFPDGTTIGAGEYLAIAKDAKILSKGFQPRFGFYPDFELLDEDNSIERLFDNSNAPNMLLVSAADGDDNTTQEMMYLGGDASTGAVVAGVASYEVILLYSDPELANLVDAVEYRNPLFWDADACAGAPGLGGPNDAWALGAPPVDYSLGRDEAAADTDSSADDFVLCSEATPGAANVLGDAVPPVASVEPASGSLLVLAYNEPVDAADVSNANNYAIDGGATVRQAWVSADRMTAVLRTSPQTPESLYALTITGVHDLAGNPVAAEPLPFEGSDAVTIAEVQAFDETGYSTLRGEQVTVAGFTTVPPGVFQPDRTSMFVQDTDGWGINLYSPNVMGVPPRFGDLLRATGTVEEYVSASNNAGATTEIAQVSIDILARGFDVVRPIVIPTGDVGREEREGQYVRTSGIVVRLDGFAYYIDDGSGSIQVYQNFTDLDFSVFAIGDSVEVTGLVLQYDYSAPYFSGYELAPRYQSDMVILEAHYAGSATIDGEAKVLDIDAGETVEITYNAPKASHVTVRVYDLKGRGIATLFDGTSLGPSRSTWDGRDDEGRKVPPGVYICHVLASARAGGDGTTEAIPIVVGRSLD